jgi:DNA replication protein DnaC
MKKSEVNMSNERHGGGLTPIGKILSSLSETPEGQSSSAEKKPRMETRTDACECRACGGKFQSEVTTYFLFQPPRVVRPRECSECRQKREDEERRLEEQELEVQRVATRERWRKGCGIPWGLHCTRFEDFEPEFQRTALRLCRNFAENFDLANPKGTASLYLYSKEPGVGKTTLMACIANYLIDSWSGDPSNAALPIRFENGPGLVRRVRATYNVPDEQKPYHETEEQVCAQLCAVKLLMLDDLGKEKPSDFTRELYWYLIDRRISLGLPVVVSSRLALETGGPLEELVKYDTVNRLYGMCRGKIIVLTGTSYRTRKLVP